MDFVEAMHVYFKGEKQLGLFLVPFGLALLGFAFYFFRTQSGGFMWGLVIPLALVGVVAGAGGAGLAIRTDRQVPALEQKYRESPRALADVEVPRMARVNRNWPILKTTWAALIVLCLAVLLLVKRDLPQGLALAFLILFSTVMMIDTFAERRARIYTEHLERVARESGAR